MQIDNFDECNYVTLYQIGKDSQTVKCVLLSLHYQFKYSLLSGLKYLYCCGHTV